MQLPSFIRCMLEIFSDKAITDISDSGNGVSESRCRCKSVDFDANFIPILSVSISGLNTRLCEMKIKRSEFNVRFLFGHRLTTISQERFNRGRGCGAVGRAVASDTGDPRFEYQPQQYCPSIAFSRMTKIKIESWGRTFKRHYF